MRCIARFDRMVAGLVDTKLLVYDECVVEANPE
jgi:hypothetical protein